MRRSLGTRGLTRLGVLAATLVATGAFALSAGAQDSTVTTQVKEPDRNLEVLDLAGQPLTELALRDGRPSAFETRVTDTYQSPDTGYQVDATMNNLHRVIDGGHSAEDMIPSGNIDLGFVGSADYGNPTVDLYPTGTLNSAQALTCDAVATTLGLTLDLSLLTSDPICGLLDDVFATLDLTNDGVEFANVNFDEVVIEAIDLSDLAVDQLPLVARTGTPGAFTDPNCATGIGAPYCSTTATTIRQTMVNSAEPLDQALIDLLTAQLPAESEIVTEIVQELQASATPLTDPADGTDTGHLVSELGDALAQYDSTDQAALVNDLIAFVWDDIGVSNLAYLSGRSSTRPTLTVDTADAVGGDYEGTLTVTLVQ